MRDWLQTNRLAIGPCGVHYCGRVWWFAIKTPYARALFSERYGYHKPLLKAFGWRLFFRKLRGPDAI